MSTYGSPNGAASWDDETIYMLELKANPRHVMVAHHQSWLRYSDPVEFYYWAEPHASVNADLTRIMWHADFNTEPNIWSFMAGLPSDWPSRI